MTMKIEQIPVVVASLNTDELIDLGILLLSSIRAGISLAEQYELLGLDFCLPEAAIRQCNLDEIGKIVVLEAIAKILKESAVGVPRDCKNGNF
jgi:hypothetical protein